MRSSPLSEGGPLVPAICVATSPLRGTPSIYGCDVLTERSVATLRRDFQSGFRFLDTSNDLTGLDVADRCDSPKGDPDGP